MPNVSEQLLTIHTAIREMLGQSVLEERLRSVVRALHELGWGQVQLTLYDEHLTLTVPETAGSVAQPFVQEHSALELIWRRGDGIEKFEPYRLGAGYFFPRGNPVMAGRGAAPTVAAEATWLPGDHLLFPLRLSDGQLVGLISLDDPVDRQRPTEEQLRPLDILITHVCSVIENQRLQQALADTTARSQSQIDELMMVQRVDQELSATLNFENVMMLTMDWAMRRTGATSGMLNMVTPDGKGLLPVAALGYPLEVLAYQTNNPLSFEQGIVGRAARTREIQIVRSVQDDPDYWPLLSSVQASIAVPMEMRGRLLGVLSLESDDAETFDNLDIAFIKRLASRAAVSLDNARLYREAEERADEMGALYAASRAISSSLERNEVLINSAQALAAVLSVSGILLAEYQTNPNRLIIVAAYRLGTARNAPDILPEVGEVFQVDTLSEIEDAVQNQRAVAVQASDITVSRGVQALLAYRNFKSLLVVPLVVQNQVLGASMLVEGRQERQFAPDEILLAEALASQSASALRQAKLYEDVRELEKLKSEMIRMASHDLRNPLGNAMGYLELLIMAIGNSLTPDQWEYVANVRRSTNAMKALIEDLLTLERLESERQTAWTPLNLSQLTHDVVEAQQDTAALKHQQLAVKIEDMNQWVRGNTTQLRQAITNLIGNAIKYTPDDGRIEVRLARQGQRLNFEVEDNGYGISQEKQNHLFQRFYRAHEPGTDHIPGTGLGLSLVKTVIERHGGEVWVKSELGKGSTFGFWLPATEPGS
jgi:signal transduction histidine kinase